MDWPSFYEDEVLPKLSAGKVFAPQDHDWTKRRDEEWRGTCPLCNSDNGRVFIVDPGDLSWYCFKCETGGGPPAYQHQREGGFGVPTGEDFEGAVRKLADTAGVEVPDTDEEDEESGEDSRRKRRPLRNPKPRKKRKAKKPAGSALTRGAQGSHTTPDTDSSPTLDTPEPKLREALSRYREALKSSDRAKAYAKSRGVPPGVLHAYGCGYAPPGEWPQDSNPAHRWKDGRIVTPLTAPGGRLINLHARAVGECPRKKRHRYWPGNPTPPAAYFNAPAIEEGSGPIVICEGPMDALSFIVEGHERAIAIYNTDGVPWGALNGSAETLVFAFDVDAESETGQTDAPKRAHEATRRGFDAHMLHDEPAYKGHNDPNDALQAGELSLDYLRGLKGGDPERENAAAGGDEATVRDNPMQGGDSGESREGVAAGGPEKHAHETGGTDGSENKPMTDGKTAGTADRENKSHDRPAEGRETAAKSSDPEAGRSPTPQQSAEGAGGEGHTAADLPGYWNGDNIGFLGKWLWKRGGVPEGDVGAGLYADRELHEWVKAQLEAGPHGTTEEEQERLRWVLWRLYAAHGREDVPEYQIPDRTDEEPTAEETRPEKADVWEERPRDPYRLGRLPEGVETTRTAAPKDNPHPGKRGIEIDSPYSEGFVHDLKVLPEWGRTWNGEAWVVDDCFAAFVGDLCRHYFGR